jgi:hypothetical protein
LQFWQLDGVVQGNTDATFTYNGLVNIRKDHVIYFGFVNGQTPTVTWNVTLVSDSQIPISFNPPSPVTVGDGATISLRMTNYSAKISHWVYLNGNLVHDATRDVPQFDHTLIVGPFLEDSTIVVRSNPY